MKNNSKLVKSADENDNWQNNSQNPKKLTGRQKLLKLKKTTKNNAQKIDQNDDKINKNIQNLTILENQKENQNKIEENLKKDLDLSFGNKIITNYKENTGQNLEKNQDQNHHIPVLITKVADFLLSKFQNSNEQNSNSSTNSDINQSQNINSQNLTQTQIDTETETQIHTQKIAIGGVDAGELEAKLDEKQERKTLEKNKKTESKLAKIIGENGEKTKLKTKLTIMDGTLGGLGYVDFLNNLVKNTGLNLELEFWGSDLDNSVIQKAQRIDNLRAKQSNFADFVGEFEDNFFDGIILDLGFSSNQLESGGRGFSHQKLDEILDLRYDADVLESASEKLLKIKDSKYLSHILYSFSGEEFSSRIAVNIYNLVQVLNAKKAKKEKIKLTVAQIVNCVCEAIPPQFLAKRNQILSRVWQSLRIWTNGEFESLQKFLKIATTKLKVGGKLIIISFHSLEDKMVANFMRKIERPIVDNWGRKTQNWKLLTKKSVKPENLEITENPRSRSAILRVLERLN